MATDKPRLRKTGAMPKRKYVRTSVCVDVETHTRWSAAAANDGVSNNAFAVEALKAALKGIVFIDRRKTGGSVDSSHEEESTEAA